MKIQDIFDLIGGDIGLHKDSQTCNPELSISQVSASSHPKPQTLIFISNPDHAVGVLKSNPAAIVLPQSYEGALPPLDFPVLVSTAPRRHMSMVMQYLSSKKRNSAFIHPNASIHESAQIGKNVFISSGVVIEKNSTIGDECHIGPNVVIEEAAVLGARVVLKAGVIIGAHCAAGEACYLDFCASIGSEGFGFERDDSGKAYPIPHQGRVVLGEQVHLGAGTRVDRGTFTDTLIGKQSHFDNMCHIAHNCKVGSYATVAACFAMAGSATIGDHFMCGGRVNVSGHLKITDHVTLVPNSSVIKDIEKPGVYGGTPVLEKGAYFKNLQVSLKLYEFYKDFRAFKKSQKTDPHSKNK